MDATDKPYRNDFEKWLEEFDKNNKANLINMNEKYYCDMEAELNGFIDNIINLNFSKIKENREKIIEDLNHQYFRTKIMYDNVKDVFIKTLQNEQICCKFGIKSKDVDIDKILTPFLIFLPMACDANFYKSNIMILKNYTNICFITCDQPIII